MSVCVTAPVAVSSRKLLRYVRPPPASDASSPTASADTATSWTCWYTVFWQSRPRDLPTTRTKDWTSTSQRRPLVILASTVVPSPADERSESASAPDTDLCTYPLVVPSHPIVRLRTALRTSCSRSVLSRRTTIPSASVS